MIGEYRLSYPATGDLAFEGKLLLEHEERSSGRIRIFETTSGKIVAEQKRAALRGTSALHRVEVLEETAELTQALDDSDGARHVLRTLGVLPTKRL